MPEDTTACPSCEENALERVQTTINVPHFGETLLITFKCKSCQYRRTEVLSLTEKPAQKFVFHVKTQDHLKVRIVKSSRAIVRIPEFQFESTPGSKAQGFIGSIETLLEQVEATLKILMKWTQDNPKKHQQLLKLQHLLQKARSEDTSFTVVLEDPSGNSAILPDPPDTVEISPLTDMKS
ncbi:MAG: ZPR1 zinc finger domain-containing protein [Candidatus Ranarchaeia archaeon]|jgi:zinc finger protein